jgi:HEAT repeats
MRFATTSTVALACAILIIVPRTSAGDAKDDRQVFRSFWPDYYRTYYSIARSEAVEDGAPLAEGEQRRLHAKLRKKSMEWARALDELLVLNDDGSFEFRYRDIAGVPVGTPWSEAVPTGRPYVRRGRWARDGRLLTLSTDYIDHQRLSEDITWRASWVGDEIVLPIYRNAAGITSVLHAQSEVERAARWSLVSLAELEREAAQIEAAVERLRHDLGGVVRAAGVPAHSPAECRGWVDVLKGEDDSQRAEAVMILGAWDCHEVVGDLIELVKGARAGSARVAASLVLGRWQATDAVPVLIEALADEDRGVRTAAEQSLFMITGHRVSVAEETPEHSRGMEVRDKWRQWWAAHRDDVVSVRPR